jgi:tellurite resistance protein
VSFPLTACAIASLRFASFRPGVVSDAIALTLLAFATLVMVGLLQRTVAGIARGELQELSA